MANPNNYHSISLSDALLNFSHATTMAFSKLVLFLDLDFVLGEPLP